MLSQVTLHVAYPIQYEKGPDLGMLGIKILMLLDIASLVVLNGLSLSSFPSTCNNKYSLESVDSNWQVDQPTYFNILHL